MFAVKVITDILCGILNALGGWHILWMRRYLMPFALGCTISLTTHIWWIGLLVLPVMGTLCLGYFLKGNRWGRSLWLFLQTFVIGLGLLLTGHIQWYYFLGYITIGLGLGWIYKDWKQILGDFITGSYLGSIIFFVR